MRLVIELTPPKAHLESDGVVVGVVTDRPEGRLKPARHAYDRYPLRHVRVRLCDDVLQSDEPSLLHSNVLDAARHRLDG